MCRRSSILVVFFTFTGPSFLVISASLRHRTHLGHDVLVVVISKRAAEFVVVHVRFALAFSPASSDLVRINQLELARCTVPRDARSVPGVGQQLQQELPQLDLSATYIHVSFTSHSLGLTSTGSDLYFEYRV